MRTNCFTLLRYLFALTIFCNHLCLLTGGNRFLFSSLICVGGFFAISGFLTFNSYNHTPNTFYYGVKRFRRIYPPYVLAVLFGLGVGLLMTTMPKSEFLLHPQTLRYVAFNLLFLNYGQPTLPGVFETNTEPFINGALWTMKVEVLFYVTVPIVHRLIGKFGKNRVLLPIIICSLVFYYTMLAMYVATDDKFFYSMTHQIIAVLPYFYIPVFLLYNFEWVKSHIKTLMLVSSVLMIPCLSTTIDSFLLPLVLPVWMVSFAYGCKWLLFSAHWKDISYQFYLFYFPVLQLTIAILGTASPVLIALVALPVTVIIATGLHMLTPATSSQR